MTPKASPTGKRLARPILASNLPRLVRRPVAAPKYAARKFLNSLLWVVTLSLMT